MLSQAGEPKLFGIESHKSDPLASFLLDSLRLMPRHLGLITLALAVVAFVVHFAVVAALPGAYGSNRVQNLSRLMIENGGFVFWFIMAPWLGFTYLWLSTAPERIFSYLHESGVKQLPDSPERNLDKWFASFYQSRRWAWVAAALAILLSLAWYFYSFGVDFPRYTDRAFPHLPSIEFLEDFEGEIDIGSVIFAPTAPLIAYILIMMILRMIQSMNAVAIGFRNGSVTIRPMHPDGCGGLGSVRDYVVTCSNIFAGAGLGLGLIALGSNYRGILLSDFALFIMAFVYVMIVVSFYNEALGTVHSSMRTYRDQCLAIFSQRYEEIYNQMHQRVNEFSPSSTARLPLNMLKGYIDDLESLKAVYKETQAWPVWPLDTAALRSVRGAATISALSVGSSIALKLLDVSFR